MKRLPPCVEPRCQKRSVRKGRCEEHQLPSFQSGRYERLPKDWGTLSLFILDRDNHICYICGESGADGVDHVIAGDDHSPSNLKAIHHNREPYCHRYKTSQEGNKAKGMYKSKEWGDYWMTQYRIEQGDNNKPPF